MFSRLGATSEIERAKTQLRELDVRPRVRAAKMEIAVLSPREKEILQLVSQHKGNKEIAKLLGCAHWNVGKHLENACRKLDAHNRHEAAEIARTRGML